MTIRVLKHKVPDHLFEMKGLADPKDRAACRKAWETGAFSLNPLAEDAEQHAARYSQAKYLKSKARA